MTIAAPLSGFLNLSAVLARPGATALSHAAAVPGVLPFEALLLVGVAHPSRDRSCSLAVGSSGVNHGRDRARPFTPGFTDVHASSQRRGSRLPTGAASAVSSACVSPRLRAPRRPGPRAPPTGSDVSEARPLRSLPPPTKPHRTATGVASRPLLPWASAPPEPCSGRPSDPRPDGPFRPPRASSRDDEGCDPSPPGEVARPRGRSTSSA